MKSGFQYKKKVGVLQGINPCLRNNSAITDGVSVHSKRLNLGKANCLCIKGKSKKIGVFDRIFIDF
jgi:hypothetical protein